MIPKQTQEIGKSKPKNDLVHINQACENIQFPMISESSYKNDEVFLILEKEPEILEVPPTQNNDKNQNFKPEITSLNSETFENEEDSTIIYLGNMNEEPIIKVDTINPFKKKQPETQIQSENESKKPDCWFFGSVSYNSQCQCFYRLFYEAEVFQCGIHSSKNQQDSKDIKNAGKIRTNSSFELSITQNDLIKTEIEKFDLENNQFFSTKFIPFLQKTYANLNINLPSSEFNQIEHKKENPINFEKISEQKMTDKISVIFQPKSIQNEKEVKTVHSQTFGKFIHPIEATKIIQNNDRTQADPNSLTNQHSNKNQTILNINFTESISSEIKKTEYHSEKSVCCNPSKIV